MSSWNAGLIPEVRDDVSGRYYQICLARINEPDDKENMEFLEAAFMENYIILKRLQGRWKKEWDDKCKYAHQKHLYKMVVD